MVKKIEKGGNGKCNARRERKYILVLLLYVCKMSASTVPVRSPKDHCSGGRLKYQGLDDQTTSGLTAGLLWPFWGLSCEKNKKRFMFMSVSLMKSWYAKEICIYTLAGHFVRVHRTHFLPHSFPLSFNLVFQRHSIWAPPPQSPPSPTSSAYVRKWLSVCGDDDDEKGCGWNSFPCAIPSDPFHAPIHMLQRRQASHNLVPVGWQSTR